MYKIPLGAVLSSVEKSPQNVRETLLFDYNLTPHGQSLAPRVSKSPYGYIDDRNALDWGKNGHLLPLNYQKGLFLTKIGQNWQKKLDV